MNNSPAPFIDHTLLKADASEKQIRKLCMEALEHGFASVCIPPVHVPLAASLLSGSPVAVSSVVGFPLGYSTSATKAFEAGNLAQAGAHELDMVIPISLALENRFDKIQEEIHEVIRAADKALVKVIIECCYLDNKTKEVLTELIVKSGASFVKTSTGFAPGGATLKDVQLLVQAAAGRIAVKAAGGIRDWKDCRAFIRAGAKRIGTSSGVTIMKQWKSEIE